MAEEFAVDTTAVLKFAGRLEAESRPARNCGAAWTYAYTHLTLTPMSGALLYNEAVEAMNATRDGVVDMLHAYGLALDGSATELIATAQAYDDTDNAADARLDRLHSGSSPQIPRDRLPLPLSYATSTSALREPASEPPSDLMGRILTADWLSPTALVMEVLDATFGYDPIKEAQKTFAGDWNAVYAAGSAAGNLAQYLETSGGYVGAETTVCLQRWHGDAALAAGAYFTDLTDRCEEFAQALKDYQAQAEGLAKAMEAQAELVAMIYTTIMDMALAGVISYGFLVLTGWTGLGGIIGYIAGTAAFGHAVWLAKQALEVMKDLKTTVDAFVAGAGALQALTMSSPTFRMPAAYDNERV